MSRHTVRSGLALIAIAAAVVAGASAHSTMTGPPPISNTKSCKVEDGRRTGNCPSPCPVHKLKSRMPVTTTSRGAQLPTRWYRNNHLDGFVRWTLVPLNKANDWDAHDKGTFEWGCYEAGTYRCSPREKREHCTFDNKGQAHRGTVAVPKSAPDGEYMLGWTWVGGVGSSKRNVRFADYHDCARVRIRGGSPLTASHQPVFRSDSSIPKAGDAPKRCLAHINGVGMRQGRQVRMMEPVGFEGGRRPAPIPTSFWGGSGVRPRRHPRWRRRQATATSPAPRPGPRCPRRRLRLAAAAEASTASGRRRRGAARSRSVISWPSASPRAPRRGRSRPPTRPPPYLVGGWCSLRLRREPSTACNSRSMGGRWQQRETTRTLSRGERERGALTAWRGAPRGTFTLQVVVRGKRGHVVSRSWRLRSA
eukprot:TRINITY_DN2712_c0_g1_i3.p1 TRINITY_DN2712_c0_g1~~TRINITY_DN2712_c0_g1_i3.p1  ORF type:complete len:420 (-),score=19.59 TRINITY_DN2712_c0_g1_i3:162-1421(-)